MIRRIVSGVLTGILALTFGLCGAKKAESAITDAVFMLSTKVAGLVVTGDLGAGTSMRLRGVSSVNGDVSPLWVIGGVIMENN